MRACTGAAEAEVGVFAAGLWAVYPGGVHRGGGLPLPHGAALGVGLHPWVQHRCSLAFCPPDYRLCTIFNHYLIMVSVIKGDHSNCLWQS